MPIFIPFKAKRPTRDKAYLVATRSYLSYSVEALEDKLAHNPYTFLHVINPKEFRDKEAGREKYKAVAAMFDSFWKDGIFIQDEEDTYYLYRQSMADKSFYGLIGGLSVLDYEKDLIKKHEHTLSAREELFKDYLMETGFHAEPVLVAHKHSDALESVYQKYFATRAEYEFTSTDKILHELWLIQDKNDLQSIQELYKKSDAFYIADGHHRSASSHRLYEHLKDEGKNVDKAQYFMSFLIDETLLNIESFYRLIKGVKQEDRLKLEQYLQNDCQAKKINSAEGLKLKTGDFTYYKAEEVWLCTFPSSCFEKSTTIESLDVQVLNDYILDHFLHIKNPKTDPRLEYRPGVVAEKEIEAWVKQSKDNIAFNVAAVDFAKVRQIADEGASMPPKSTYIEPKLRSGLLIYDFKD